MPAIEIAGPVRSQAYRGPHGNPIERAEPQLGGTLYG